MLAQARLSSIMLATQCNW